VLNRWTAEPSLRTTLIVAIVIAVAAAGAFLFLRGRRLPTDPRPGALFSSRNEDGSYSVFKVLAVDAAGIHIRIYSNRFSSHPTSLTESALELKSIHTSENPGIGHLPLSRDAYWRMDQTFIQQSSVAKEELEGYEMFKESGGGTWQ
jgi:hypothetical protein